jgi:hypothetical protein
VVVRVDRTAEEAVRQAELERDDVREREHRDLVPLWRDRRNETGGLRNAVRHLPEAPFSFPRHGRIFAHVGFQATGPSGGTLRGFVP